MKKIVLPVLVVMLFGNNLSFGQQMLTDANNNPVEGFGLVKDPNSNIVYFGKTDNITNTAIYKGILSDGKITDVKKNFIIDENSQETIPFFSTAGNYIFLFSNFKNPNPKNLDLWFGKYDKKSGIQDLKKATTANTDSVEYYGSMANNGIIYFSSWRKAGYGRGDVFSTKFKNGKFSAVNHLDKSINNSHINSSPAISPKGDWFIFYTKNENSKSADLCVSFLNSGKWSEPIKLPNLVNTSNFEFAPVLADNGKTLYFSRREKSHLSDNQVYHIYKISIQELELGKLKATAQY
jgi:hypothetical protein